MIFDKVLYGKVTVLSLLIGILILFVGVGVARVISIYTKRIFKKKFKSEYREIFVKIIYYALIIIACLVALPLLGFNLSGLLVAGGVVGIALGFASQSIVSNLLSGILLMIERPIKIGDSVKIDGTTGIVEDIQIISTTLRMFNGVFARVPNQKVFSAEILNYDANAARRFEYKIGIGYQDDAVKAIGVINAILEKEPLVLKNPAPFVFVDELGDSSVNIIVRPWAPSLEWFALYRELLWKIKAALEAEGIEIPFPQRVLWYADKQEMATP